MTQKFTLYQITTNMFFSLSENHETFNAVRFLTCFKFCLLFRFQVNVHGAPVAASFTPACSTRATTACSPRRGRSYPEPICRKCRRQNLQHHQQHRRQMLRQQGILLTRFCHGATCHYGGRGSLQQLLG